MIHPEAILRFQDRQKKLLRSTYDEAWKQGVASYEPDDDPEEEPRTPRGEAIGGLSGTALLLALRRYRYSPPPHPDPVRRVVALAPAFRSLNKMVGELSALAAGSATEIVASGGDMSAALEQWASSNAYRLSLGESVAWAGEQAGFAEAATQDGVLLQWMSEGDSKVCDTCLALSSYPPMMLQDWPTVPGEGLSECSVGCRCTLDTVGDVSLSDYVPQLTQAQSDLVGSLADQQAQSLADLMPDVAYLE